jgi:hypothetical protein
MYRDSCARGFKADLRHPDVSITEQAYVWYGMNDTVWNRYGYVTTCRLRYYRTVLFVPVPYKYIDQCKDTVREEWVPCIPVQAKGKDAKHCRYIWRIVRKRNRVQCRVGVECFPQLAVVPLFREQYRLVDNSILLLVCLGRSVEYAGPQRMHRAQRQKNESLSVSV